MKYQRFEQLPVWQAALDVAQRVYRLTRGRFFSQPGDLRDQLRRAALSISNNIAEGFERGSTAELLMFLYIARGSAGEVRSMLHFCVSVLDGTPESELAKLPYQISNLKSEISDLVKLAESCSRQLRAWADALQNSEIKGQRHLTEETHKAFALRQRAKAFHERIEESFRKARPELFREDA